MELLRALALLAFALALLAAEGWLLNPSLHHALAFVAVGLAAWLVSGFVGPVLDRRP